LCESCQKAILFFLNDYLASNSNLSIFLLSLFCPDLHRDGCQFNMSRNVSSFLLSAFILKAGAKVYILFYLASLFENIFNLIFSVLVFSNLKIVFPSAGCKDNNTFHFYKSFLNEIS